MLQRILQTNAPATVILIRISVGFIFVSEGIQKFIYPAEIGAERFAKMGFAAAEFLAPFVGVFEIVCGLAVLLGLLTRVAAIPLICVMVTAIIATKVPILLGHDFLGFTLRELKYYGFWSMAHEARTDFAMLMGSLFLLCTGGGAYSVDAVLQRRSEK